jgi:hypothetical protein
LLDPPAPGPDLVEAVEEHRRSHREREGGAPPRRERERKGRRRAGRGNGEGAAAPTEEGGRAPPRRERERGGHRRARRGGLRTALSGEEDRSALRRGGMRVWEGEEKAGSVGEK